MSQRIRKAEYLLDELGLISDSMVAEAMLTSVPAKRKSVSWRRAVTAIAAAAVVLTLSASLLLVGLIRDNESGKDGGIADVYPETLEGALVKAQESDMAGVYASAESVGLFDGERKLIWRDVDGGDYYSLSVTGKSELGRLEKALTSTYALSEAVDGEENIGVLVWISYGDGRVVSPYLRSSEGNVGYGELFEYSPEIMPARELTELTLDLISE